MNKVAEILGKLKALMGRAGAKAKIMATSPKYPDSKAPVEWEGLLKSMPYGAAGAVAGGVSDEDSPLKGALVGGALGAGHGLFSGGILRAARQARAEAELAGKTAIPAHEAAHMLSMMSLGAAAGGATGESGDDRLRRMIYGAGIGGGARSGRVLAKVLGTGKGLTMPLSVPLIPAGGYGGYELSKALESEYDKRKARQVAPSAPIQV